ncbi:MAG: phosphate signaling complex protein PhoU [Phycisphaeraceae bacterium]|nr:phosphate signaling complex protein PhoU [Phycisphaeraceae bacterium]
MAVDLRNELVELRRNLLAMGALVEQRVTKVIESMIDGDVSAAEAVRNGDNEVDAMEVEIEGICMRLLALAQPVASDLRFILATIRVSGELERIADLARGIAKKLIKLSAVTEIEMPPAMTDLAFAARTMLSDVLAALANEDAALCRQVRRADRRVDDLYKEILAWGRKEIPEHVEATGAAIDILTVAQRFERMADMTTNIAEDVIFLVEGRVVRHGGQ